MSGLGTENSDIDMCLLIRSTSADPRSDAVRYLEMIKTSLQACGIRETHLILIFEEIIYIAF